jgi:alpha-D-xyloside xylohydrolase
MYGPQPDAVIADYRYLTGAAPMFGKWAWGYWQSKNAYSSQAELIGVENQYRTSNIPIDNIVQDWMYWNPNPWGSDIFNSTGYSNVAQLMQTLHNNNIHMMISKWARFDRGGYANYLQLSNAGALYPELVTATPDAQYYDAFNPTGRQLYWQQVSNDLFSLGIDGWWLDASEPELNVNWGEYANYTTAAGSGAAVYNAYPLMHTTALYQGQRGASASKRVFILTRSAYAGQQRNAAVTWSGDIASTWTSFALQIPAGLNFSVSGIPYWNTDIGGYQDSNGTPTDAAYAELFTRWFQYGAFCPMFRVHGQNFGKEMWQFPANTEAILVNFDQLRYHLLPYIYSVAWMVTTNGYTMMRPLVMDFGQDANVYSIPDQFMFGPAMMANPVTQAGATNRNVYLPAGTTWYDFWTGLTYMGGQTNNAAAPITEMPLYVPAGSIIPYGPAIQYASQSVDPTELRVYRGANGAFTLYEDEDDNYDYESGAYATIPFIWNESTQTLTIGQRQGSFSGMLQSRTFNIVWVSSRHGVGVPSTANADVTVQYTGSTTNITFGN